MPKKKETVTVEMEIMLPKIEIELDEYVMQEAISESVDTVTREVFGDESDFAAGLRAALTEQLQTFDFAAAAKKAIAANVKKMVSGAV